MDMKRVGIGEKQFQIFLQLIPLKQSNSKLMPEQNFYLHVKMKYLNQEKQIHFSENPLNKQA